MSFTWHGEAARERRRKAAAARLIQWGQALVLQAREDLSVPNPAPHKNSSVSGQFPRLRTGNLQASVKSSPAGLYAVMSEGRVVVGYSPAAPYWRPLMVSGRLWLLESLTRLKWRTRGELPTAKPTTSTAVREA